MRRLLLGLALMIVVLAAAPAFPQDAETCYYLEDRIIYWGAKVFHYSSAGPEPNVSLMETASAMQNAYMDAFIDEGCFGEV